MNRIRKQEKWVYYSTRYSTVYRIREQEKRLYSVQDKRTRKGIVQVQDNRIRKGIEQCTVYKTKNKKRNSTG